MDSRGVNGIRRPTEKGSPADDPTPAACQATSHESERPSVQPSPDSTVAESGSQLIATSSSNKGRLSLAFTSGG